MGKETLLEFDPDGAVDREVGVVRIDDEDHHPIAAIISYACHPVVLSRRSYAVSADFGGWTREMFEAVCSARGLSLQGCAGNMNPIVSMIDSDENNYENCRELGAKLAAEALRTFVKVDASPPAGVAATLRRQVSLSATRPCTRY